MSRSQILALFWVIVLAVAAGMLYSSLTSAGPQRGSSVVVDDERLAPPAAPVEPPSTAPIQSLRVDSIGVAAPVVVLGVNADGVMDTPAEPMDVAWYNFSAYPGYPGNAVFAGHVDHVKTGAAVFHGLRDLKPGDSIEVALRDGTSYRYTVTTSSTYYDAFAPVQEIVGPTERESITLITCIGAFDPVTRSYDQRLIVRAERTDP